MEVRPFPTTTAGLRRLAAWLEHDTDTALQRLAGVGVTPTFWRTPWGDTAPWSTQIARDRGNLVHYTAALLECGGPLRKIAD